MAYDRQIKEKAVQLRRKGFSLNEVVRALMISKSTASYWLEDIELGSRAIKRLEKRKIIGQYKTVQIKKIKRVKLFKRLGTEAVKKIELINFDKKIYQLLASVLFWCEGTKGRLARVGFTNSDPKMVEFFFKCLRKGFEIKEEKFRIVVHLHSYHNEKTQIEFWSRVTGVPKSNFTKSFKKKNSGKRIRKDYQGCVSLRYYDARLAKKLWVYYNELQKLI